MTNRIMMTFTALIRSVVAKRPALLPAVAVVLLLSAGCGGSSAEDGQAATSPSDSSAEESTSAAEPTPAPEPTAEPEPTATSIPVPTATVEPTPTPNPDLDDDGVANEDDAFPEDPTRSVLLTSVFPRVDRVAQLDESLPVVQALRDVQGLAADEAPPAERFTELFAPSFLSSFSTAAIHETLTGSATTDWQVLEVRTVTPWWMWVQMGNPARTNQTTTLLRLALDPNTNLITDLALNAWFEGLEAQQYPDDKVKTIDQVVDELTDMTQFVGLLVADVTADGCSTIVGHEEDAILATGSIYKQWVLGAAATQIANGVLSPDDPVLFTPGQYMTGGAFTTSQFTAPVEMTLQTAANLMMGQSDNGATDMVERAVGRQPVWDFVETSGHTMPNELNPMIGIRDYDHLYSSVPQSAVDSYLAGSEEQQEAFIVDVLEPLGPTRLNLYGNAGVRDFSWQASPTDICETMATMRARFGPDTEAGRFIDAAYGAETSLFGVRNAWDRVWYKGGSIPGTTPDTLIVYTHATMVESNDGRTHAVVAMFNADQGFSIDQMQFEIASLLSRLHQLLLAGL